MLFKELFLVAANELANTIQEPLANLGVLFDDIISTGTVKRSKYGASIFKTSLNSSIRDATSAGKDDDPITYGRGQVLFAVRQVTKLESMRLQASGHRFASISNIIDLLARSMEVTTQELGVCLAQMCSYAGAERILEPGVHVGCFALRPLIHRGFEILVEKKAKNMLPTIPLQLGTLEQWQLDMLIQMKNWTVSNCMEQLPTLSFRSSLKEQKFASQLLDGLATLIARMNTPFFQDARLVASPFEVPCRLDASGSGQASLISFRILTSVHERKAIGDSFEFASLRFFFCQQHTYKDSKDNQIFARKLHREFSGVAEHPLSRGAIVKPSPRYSFFKTGHDYTQRKTGPKSVVRSWPSQIRSIGSHLTMHDSSSSSQSEIEDSRNSQDVLVQAPPPVHGGIQVFRDINVDVREVKRAGSNMELEMVDLGYFNEVGLDEEVETFAEKLVSLTIDERRRTGV